MKPKTKQFLISGAYDLVWILFISTGVGALVKLLSLKAVVIVFISACIYYSIQRSAK